ncbi:hypothetical protein DUI87_06753 [Hirundo rustica rustica]|uniref:Uncharacterized protein n=1 Tax=Hirundo rustica rustica TaxID=333673 RepID=A0A3M0KY77_HIRRU|nr:hypothetical protein DUI87_06753 [Hirundo rustica rustica]
MISGAGQEDRAKPESMSFPVDILNNYSHEELENSAEDYLFDLRWGIQTLLNSFLYQTIARFRISVALYLADQWWSIDDIVRTSVPARQGLHQVKSVGERIVLYVLNRIIYRTQEMEKNEIPFLCHGSSHFAKIMWKKGEAVGFYSVKPTACKQYLEKYPGDKNLLWQVEGGGDWFQRKSMMSIVQKENLRIAEASKKESKSLQAEDNLSQSAVSEASGQRMEVETQLSEMPSEPLNGEVTEETGKTSLVAEGETVNEVPSGESKLPSENQGKEPVTLFVPLTLDTPAKPPEDTESEKALNENDSEMLTEEVASVEKEGTEEQQESEKASTENAAASASKEEPSDNGLPNSVVTEAAEESVSENLPSSLEDQNEEAGHNSQETPAALGQSSLVMVELEGVSFQQPSGQEAQKSQLEEPSEESAEQTDHYTQAVAERAADSSSEEAEIEVPIVDRKKLAKKG